ncbi:hypothetical protein [Azohydromonas australica]|uniref:hypothetical protein n=1 Tax=Azohydromonas australica TaxID=364039 RepID=UPI00146A37DD|nr:hypothetical protein [Azohydromonas australica]
MNPFAQLVSPQSQVEAIAASAELSQLPTHFYRPLDADYGRWKKAPEPQVPPRPLKQPVVWPGATARALPEQRRDWNAPPLPGTGLRR